MTKRDIEQGARRSRMRNSDCVESLRSYQCEVLLDLGGVVIFAFVGVWPKSTVSNAFDVKLLCANINEFPNNTWPDHARCCSSNWRSQQLSRRFRACFKYRLGSFYA